MSFNPTYPELFKGANTDNVAAPYMLEGRRAFQQCYVCGMCIQFAKDGGKWLSIGGGLIRHKDCDPPPYTGRRGTL